MNEDYEFNDLISKSEQISNILSGESFGLSLDALAVVTSTVMQAIWKINNSQAYISYERFKEIVSKRLNELESNEGISK